MSRQQTSHTAFTLVEVLVVIAIIGILVALLLPAIQSAREAARRSQCLDNLKQMGIAVQTYHDSKRRYPSGRDGDNQTSVSWAFSLLPFMEEDAIFKTRVASQPDTSAANAAAMRTPVATYFCPSRRSPAADRDFLKGPAEPAPNGQGAAAGDYAANAGSDEPDYGFQNSQPLRHIDQTVAGPMFTVSHISAKQVVDGLSKTLAVGERYLPPPRDDLPPEKVGADQGDTAFFSGDEAVTVMRSTKDGFPSSKDDPSSKKFGSEHAGLSHFVMLDGHVTPIRHDIDIITFQRLSSIGDGEIIPNDLL